MCPSMPISMRYPHEEGYYFVSGNDEVVNFAIRGVLISSISILGMIANSLCVIVFTRPEMKSPINTILTGKH